MLTTKILQHFPKNVDQYSVCRSKIVFIFQNFCAKEWVNNFFQCSKTSIAFYLLDESWDHDVIMIAAGWGVERTVRFERKGELCCYCCGWTVSKSSGTRAMSHEQSSLNLTDSNEKEKRTGSTTTSMAKKRMKFDEKKKFSWIYFFIRLKFFLNYLIVSWIIISLIHK